MKAVIYIKAAQRVRKTCRDPRLVKTDPVSGLIIFDDLFSQTFTKSYLPEPEELEGTDAQVFFIEPDVTNTWVTDEDRAKLDQLSTNPNVRIENKFRNTLQQIYYDPEYTQITVLDYSGMTDVFDFFSEAKIPYADNTRVRIAFLNSKKSFSKIDRIKFISYYDLFSMDEFPSEIHKGEDFTKHISVLAQMLIKYLELGFHKRQKITISDERVWQLNITVPEMELFIIKYQIYPTTPDQKQMWYYQFTKDGDYRQTLTLQLAKFFAHLLRNNGDEEPRRERDWLNPAVYRDLV